MTTTTPQRLLPRALKAGDTIGIITTGAPEAALNRERFERGLERIKGLGFNVQLAPHAVTQSGYMAGREEQLGRDVMEFFADPRVAAIFCSAGGVTSNRLLRRLDFDVVAMNPKMILGASDPTVLINAIHARTGLITFHGPAVVWDWGSEEQVPDWTRDHLQKLVRGDSGGASLVGSSLDWIRPGGAQGRLLGGCLSALRGLLGTPYEPNWDGAIFLWEDCFKSMDYLDTVLTHFRDAGVFDRIAGMVIGELLECQPSAGRGLKDMIGDLLGEYRFPVVSGLAFGHTPIKHTLPIGGDIRLDGDRRTISLVGPWALSE